MRNLTRLVLTTPIAVMTMLAACSGPFRDSPERRPDSSGTRSGPVSGSHGVEGSGLFVDLTGRSFPTGEVERSFYESHFERATRLGARRVVFHGLVGDGSAHGQPNRLGDYFDLVDARSVPVYESVRFYQQPAPNIQAVGLPWMPMAHNADMRVAPQGDWLNVSPAGVVEAIDKLGLPRTYDGPVILDYEPYVKPWQGQRTIDAYMTVLLTARERLPNAQIAFFGIPTVRVRDREGGPARPMTIEMIRPVLEAQDFVAPQVYTDDTDYEADAQRVDRARMREAKSIGKPVYPVIRPRTSGFTGEKWLDPSVVAARVDLLKREGAAGVVVWEKQPTDDDPRDAQRLATVLSLLQSRESRTQVFLDTVRPFLISQPDARVGVVLSDVLEEEIDASDTAAQAAFIERVIRPLYDVGVREFWFAPGDDFESWLPLMERVGTLDGVTIGAFKPELSGGPIDRELAQVGFLAGDDEWASMLRTWQIPAGANLHVVMDSSGTLPTSSLASAWRSRGWSLLSADVEMDDLVFP